MASELLKQAVEWTLKWEYRLITELLGAVRVPKDVAENFKLIVERLPGNTTLSQNILLNEEGVSWIEISTVPGRLYVAIAHPTTDKVDIVYIVGDCNVTAVTSVNRITVLSIDVYSQGTIKIGLKALSDVSLNPAYIQVKQEQPPTTTTQPTTPTPTIPTPTTTPTTPIITPTTPTIPTETSPTTVYEKTPEWSLIIPLVVAIIIVIIIIGKFVLKKK